MSVRWSILDSGSLHWKAGRGRCVKFGQDAWSGVFDGELDVSSAGGGVRARRMMLRFKWGSEVGAGSDNRVAVEVSCWRQRMSSNWNKLLQAYVRACACHAVSAGLVLSSQWM